MEKRKTKIIATIGPATIEFNVLKKLVAEGMDVARFNSAYGSKEQYNLLVKQLRKINKNVQIIFDIRNAKALEYLDETNMPEMVALSFTETAEQLKEIQRIVPKTKLIAKIETRKGVSNFNKIISNCWGVMVARGDLGQTASLEEIPCLQKKITKKTQLKRKFLIVATEMLLSMVDKNKPTRAEVSDVGNAVFDNACAVMLSEETAIGKYPVESVGYMRRIVECSEQCKYKRKQI